MIQKINQEMLEHAVSILGKTYNDPKEKEISQAIDLLRKSMVSKKAAETFRADEVPPDAGVFYKTGAPWMDAWLRGGLRKQELVLIGAIPAAGKTHTLAWFGSQYLYEGYDVLHVIGEDLLSDVRDYYAKGFKQEVWDEVQKHLWLSNVQDVSFGVPQVEEIYENLKEKGTPPTVTIVDHVDLMKGTSGKADWEQVTDVMLGLKMLAKRTDSILITASQLTYDKESKGNARFYRAKVGKAANADVILMIDDVIENEYRVSLTKARARKAVPSDKKQKSLWVNWDTMEIQDVSG